ncbi:hypothetical protein Tco_1328170 [Tanacetum coccineum]
MVKKTAKLCVVLLLGSFEPASCGPCALLAIFTDTSSVVCSTYSLFILQVIIVTYLLLLRFLIATFYSVLEYRTKRKLVCKSTGVGSSTCSDQPSVVGRDLCQNDCGVGLSPFTNRQRIRESNSVPSCEHGLQLPGVPDVGPNVSPDNVVARDLTDNHHGVGSSVSPKRQVSGVGPSVLPDNIGSRDLCDDYCDIGLSISPKRQCVRQLNSVPYSDLRLYTPTVPAAVSFQSLSRSTSIGGINRPSITSKRHNDDVAYTVHAGTSSNRQLGAGSRQSVVHVSTNLASATPKSMSGHILGGNLQLVVSHVLVRRAFKEQCKRGAHIDESVNNGRGPYVFKIPGQLEVDNRMRHFGADNSELRRDIVEGLIDLLDAQNALV